MKFLAVERRALLAAILLAIAACLPAAAQEPGRGVYTPPAADTVHAVVAEHGMVVAQEKIAAHIGADVLKRGGNAVDAAVAIGFTMAVTYPRAGNIGGDGKPDRRKSLDSALAIGVPGTVAGLALALDKYGSGKFTLAELLKPAI